MQIDASVYHSRDPAGLRPVSDAVIEPGLPGLLELARHTDFRYTATKPKANQGVRI